MKNVVAGFLLAIVLIAALVVYGLARWGAALNGLDASVATIVAPDDTVRVTIPQETAVPQPTAQQVIIVEVTAAPSPTQPPTAEPTSPPAPTRPAIETLPLGEGPYTVKQMQVCRDVWAQSLQGELTPHQFSYCQAVVNRGQ